MSLVVAREANPFGEPMPTHASANQSAALTDQQRAIAEVQAAIVIARANPRNPVAAMDRIINACTRPKLAEVALYQYARGGADVRGPSIRMAEMLAQQWGNMKTSVRELDQANGVSTVQTIAWDLETGTQVDKVFQVPHIRYTKNGSKTLTDPRDIYELVANQGARRLRACILAVIPGDVIETAVNQCDVTLKTTCDASPEAIAKMLEAFSGFGVSREQIEKRVQRRLDAIQPAQMALMKKIYASLRDGMSDTSDWFDAQEAGANAPVSKPACTDAEFAKNKQAWAKAIQGGKTAQQVIAQVQSRFGLSEPQIAEILKIEQEAALPQAASTRSRITEFFQGINACTSADTAAEILDEARGEVSQAEYVALVEARNARFAEVA